MKSKKTATNFKFNSTILLQAIVMTGVVAIAAKASPVPDLSDFNGYVLTESVAVDGEYLKGQQLHQDKMVMTEDFSGTVYFLNEGAGYQNSFIVDTQNTSKTIFDNASCVSTKCVLPNMNLTPSQGVVPGQAVAFNFKKGDHLNPKLLVNGALNPSTKTYWGAFTSQNVDNSQHVMAFEHKDCSSLGIKNSCLVLGYEDMDFRNPSNDKDYNDLVFILDIGQTNINNIPKVVPTIFPD
jgi:hypothetical protein